jgi:hypothetical protein
MVDCHSSVKTSVHTCSGLLYKYAPQTRARLMYRGVYKNHFINGPEPGLVLCLTALQCSAAQPCWESQEWNRGTPPISGS